MLIEHTRKEHQRTCEFVDLATCTAPFDEAWLSDGLCFEATVGAHERGKQHNDGKQAAIPGYEEHDRA